ncbi:MAG: hypothetical protein OEU36_01975 [Gammaproteobacteria bacterium]|nr:hypothetical protein [Gammaproteobacteria bacterium]
MRRRPKATHLQLVPASPRPNCSLDAVQLIESSEHCAPFFVDAMTFEEDTSLVLSADTTVRDTGEHLVRIMTALYQEQSRPPGCVVVQRRHPYRFLAIVHDLEQQPSWREEWVVSALGEVFALCNTLHITALGLEPLGAKHGRLPLARFRELLNAALEAAPMGDLKKIWIVTV